MACCCSTSRWACRSNDALQKAKRLFRAEKAGHTGTLDPLATGLLPLCFGAATKFSQVSLDADKAYRATLRLGQRTRTGDAEGEVIEERSVQVDRAAIDAAVAACTGQIEQMPPMYSALKHEGKALYEYARAGIEIERAPRRVHIHRIEIVEWQAERLVLDVACSKGTYIRTLAEDIGEALGCGAHLSALRRTASGALGLADAVTLEQLSAMSEPERDALLLPADALLAGWPAGAPARRRSRPLPHRSAPTRRLGRCPCRARLWPATHHQRRPGRCFLGSAHIAGGELIADRLLSPAEVAGTNCFIESLK